MSEYEYNAEAEAHAPLEGYLGHTFANKQLLLTALRHKSYVNEKGAGQAHNERLEFLGDAVLQLLVTTMLMEGGPQHSEGALSLMRSQVVSEVSLAQLAAEIELGSHLQLGRGEDQSGGRLKPSLLADAFEALIGAIYQDRGFEYTLRTARRLLGPSIERVLQRSSLDYKSALQEYLQGSQKVRPRYEVVSTAGPDHNKTFEVKVLLGEEELGRGSGKSKREAEHHAAEAALELLTSQQPAAAETPASSQRTPSKKTPRSRRTPSRRTPSRRTPAPAAVEDADSRQSAPRVD